MAVHPLLYEGRTPPKGLALHSRDLQNWYDEQLYYCWNGRTVQLDGGKTIEVTGDQYFYNNFTPIQTFYDDPLSPGKTLVDWTFPLYSQEDDWVFKQMREAEQQDKMGFMLFTGRGYGKTFKVVSIGMKYYYLEVGSHCLLSGAIDDHARPTFEKTQKMMTRLEKIHPLLALKRINENDDIIQAGQRQEVAGVWTNVETSQMEKIVWGNSPGKAKGRRLAVHHWEEVGDHSCPAPLNECFTASKGSWKVGSVKTCRTFYTGTGGTIKSDQAWQMFSNPLAYDIYPCQLYQERKLSILIDGYRDEATEQAAHACFMPSVVKRGKYWEFDRYDEAGNLLFEAGESDAEGALVDILQERKNAESEPDVYNKLVQEYPLTIDECFRQSGKGEFDRVKLGLHKQKLVGKKLHLPGQPTVFAPEQGTFEWIYVNGLKADVAWVPGRDKDRHKVFIVEHPPLDPVSGKRLPIRNMYIGGIDSIDQGKLDSVSGNTRGSKFAMLVKKRQGAITQTGNMYVCQYMDRPDDPDDAFDMSLRILWYYSARTNFEYTKISIKPYYRNARPSEYWRFVLRPKIGGASTDPTQESSLIGTLMNDQVLQYGIKRIRAIIRTALDNLLLPELVQQLIDYTLLQKTKYDLVVAMIMCEIADEDMADELPETIKEPEPVQLPYYYTDENGYMQYGVPDQLPAEQLGRRFDRRVPDYYDVERGVQVYADGSYD